MKKSTEWMLSYAEGSLDRKATVYVLLNGERFAIHSISGEVEKGLITVTLATGGVLAFDADASWGILRAD